VLKLFRTNHLATGVLLLFYAAMIRSAVFAIQPSEVIPDKTGILSSFIYQLIDIPGLLPDILSIIIIFINALIINYLVARNFLSKEINLFPGLFYIFVSSCVPDFLSFSSLHIANTFVILASFSLFAMNQKSESAKNIFNAGLLIGISTLFNFSYWLLLPWLLLAVSNLQSLKFKRIIIAFAGYALPWIYTFLYFYWVGKTDELFANHIDNQFNFLNFNFGSTLFDYLPLAIFPIIIFALLIRFNQNFVKQKFGVKKKISLLYWLLFFGVLFLCTGKVTTAEDLLIFSVPAGILLSFSFTRMKSPYDEFTHLILLIFVVLMQYFVFLKVI
jgi:hypothetical protein